MTDAGSETNTNTGQTDNTYTPPTTTTGNDTYTPPVTTTNTGTVFTETSSDGEYTARGTSAKDNVSYTSTAARFQGTYYRIQVAAVGKYNAAHAKFNNLSLFGPVYTEYLASRNLTRVLVGDYFNQSEVQTVLSEVKKTIKGAFVVKYDDGVRYGRYNF